jgi:hypothetical protein
MWMCKDMQRAQIITADSASPGSAGINGIHLPERRGNAKKTSTTWKSGYPEMRTHKRKTAKH